MFNVEHVTSDKKFNVVILAAGLGSRLKHLTKDVPKPMIDLGNKASKGIDTLIEKFRYVTNTFIICTGYLNEVLKDHITRTHPDLKFKFVEQKVSELSNGPGKTAILGLKACNNDLPTIFLFCDIIIEDKLDLNKDALGLCKPTKGGYVLDAYKTVAIVKNGLIKDIILNKNFKTEKLNGWFGTTICHDTKLLLSIADELINKKDIADIDYSLDLIREYVKRKDTVPAYASRIYEFGTMETYNKLMQVLYTKSTSSKA